ncbi:hypothetical protein OAK75_00015 [Bacteriovoracales bacterium]|nr:hypothetical protein [Bacteriovoracales bacterium]
MARKKNVLIVSHDSGGAEVVSAWIKNNHADYQFYYCLMGPALPIFEKKIGPLDNIKEDSLNDFFKEKKINTVFTGTSWEDFLELRVIEKAKNFQVKTVTFLDSWQNHRERFGYPNKNWEKNLPDEIWCGDSYCIDVCLNLNFPKEKLKFVENEYFNEMKKLGRNYKIEPSANSILYLCEPIADHMKKQHGDELYLGYNEFSAIKNFKKNILKITEKPNFITFRSHPSEDIKKYSSFIKEKDWPCEIKISQDKNLVKDILSHEYIVGCETMALVISIMVGKKVISAIPKEGRPCQLPFKEIQHLL